MTTAMKTYVAEYEYDGRAWVVQFREPDMSTFGRTLRSAKRYARELLATYLEVDDLEAAGIDVDDRVKLSGSLPETVGRLTADRARAESLRAEVAAETRRAALELRRAGYSTRDVAEILGVSSARVAQIEHETPAA